MVETTDIDQMTRLIALMNGSASSVAPSRAQAPTALHVDSNIAAMKSILSVLQDSGQVERTAENVKRAAHTLIEDAEADRSLREAMLTERTEHGVLVGVWEIRAKTGSGRKLFDVIKLGEAEAIATDLTIYEAAYGLACALNDGLPITSKPIRALLLTEGEYANAVHDAIHAKATLRRDTLHEAKRALAEDRYGAAVRRARDARGRIQALATRR